MKAKRTSDELKYSEDFSWVKWRDQTFAFGIMQSRVMKLLIAQREKAPDVPLSDQHLLTLSHSSCKRLRDVFRYHPAWKTLIEEADRPGFRRLAD